MKIERIPARLHHCGQIVRHLRKEQRALFAAAGTPAHRQIREYFGFSAIRQAWKIDGKLAGLAGVVGSVASPEGILWLALTEAAASHPIVARTARRFINEIKVTTPDLTLTVLAGDPKSVQLAYFLGFTSTERTKIGGIPVIHMAHRGRKAA